MQLRDTLLLLVEDSAERIRLRNLFQDSYNILEAHNRAQLRLLLEHNEKIIAAVIVKAPPPENKSDSVIHMLERSGLLQTIPVILMLPPENAGDEFSEYIAGATDVIIEPCDDRVVFQRIKNVVDLSIYKSNLESLVEKQSRDLRDANDNMVDALSAIIEYRSAESGKHVLRVRHYTKVLLNDMALAYPEYGISESMIDKISGASSLHDIGKISIPDSILNKPDKLTDEEFGLMKHHTTNGARMIENLVGIADEEYLRYAYNICLYHHERWDGNGYPAGLKGDEIPLCAQVVSIADVYDVLTTERVYKAPYPHNQAMSMILNGECGAFSPKLLESLKNVREQFIELSHKLSDDSNIRADELMDSLLKPIPALDSANASLTNVHDAYLSLPKSGQYLTSQALQAKYQSLVHYLNATIIEVDIANDSYHIVYNPHTDFRFPPSKNSFTEALEEAVATMVHPDDRGFEKSFYDECEKNFHALAQRRFGWEARIYQPSFKEYFPWKTTVVKIESDNPSHDDVLVIITPVKEQVIMHHDNQSSLQRRATTYDISGSVVCCKNDYGFTLADGAGNLYNLLGYTADEVHSLFGNKLLNMVIPEDRERARLSTRTQLGESTTFTLNHRMKCKDGSVIWVFTKAKLVVEKDGTEYIYATLNDNTFTMNALEALTLEAETNRIIIDQSDDIVFEWDLENDYMDCSPKWEKRFGYRPASDSFTLKMSEASHFHPDDIAVMAQYIDKVKSGASRLEVEVRIANLEGRYLWNLIKATVVKDNDGNPVRIVGVISDIHKGKHTMQTLIRQAEEDTLTKLLHRGAATSRIKSMLDDAENEALSAMLLVDIDNFKFVNDTYGHLFGDKILCRAADEIRGLFRAKDIISRVGGDEFLVFLSDITAYELVERRAGQLVENMRDAFASLIDDADGLQLTCSIGISLAPQDGTTFLELYEKADKALYKAKHSGKNQYVIHSK